MKSFIKKCFVILPFVLCEFTIVNGQNKQHNVKFEQIITEYGFIYPISQDSKGFLYFGNKNKLLKYDGIRVKEFEVFESSSFSENGFSFIADIECDSLNNLWVGTARGLVFFDNELEKFTIYEDSLLTNINDIYLRSDGDLWIGTVQNGLVYYNPKSDSIKSFKQDSGNPYSISTNMVLTVFEDSEGVIWIGTYSSENNNNLGGLVRYDLTSELFTLYQSDPLDKRVWAGSNVFDIMEADEGNLWVATAGGLTKFNKSSGEFIFYEHNKTDLSNNVVQQFVMDKDGKIWITSQSEGIFRFNPTTESFLNFRHNNRNPSSYSSLGVWGFLIDNSGVLWTLNGTSGVDKLNLEYFEINHISESDNSKLSLSSNEIFDIVVGKDSLLWISTANGLNIIDVHKNSSKVIHTDSKLETSVSNIVFCSELDIDGNVWLGTPRGLEKLDLHSGYLKTYTPTNENFKSISSIVIDHLYIDNSGELWIVCNSTVAQGKPGLNLYNKEKDNFTVIDFPPGVLILDLFEDSNSNFWLGTNKGLALLNRKENKISFHLNDSSSIMKNIVITCFAEVGGKLWMGTENGLISYDYNDNFKRFPQNLHVYDLVAFDKYLWLVTNNGIQKYNTENGKTLKFGAKDGFASNDSRLIDLMPNENIVVGSNKGINIFNPKNLKANPIIPEIVITDFKVFNKSVNIDTNSNKEDEFNGLLRKSISSTDEITLSHKENVITFEFAALHFTNPTLNQYAYKMEGFDKEWVNSGSKNEATYTNLDPGKYTFKVKGSNDDGVWNDSGTFIDLIITPPWWKTPFAFFSYFIVIVGTLTGLYKWRTAETKRKLNQQQAINTKLKKVDQLKDQFLANTSHELRTPLNGIIGLADSLQDGIAGPLPPKANKDLEMISSSGRRLNNLVNDILDFSKLRNNELQLNKQAIGLFAATDVVLHLSQPLAEAKELKLINDVSKDLPPVYADENRLQQMLFNLVGNAIKFTESGYVKVSAIEIGTSIIISIEDTGIGIPEEKHETIFDSFVQIEETDSRQFSGTGLGLSVTRQLVELHEGKIEVNSEVGHGSTFKLYLPIADDEAIDSATSNLSVIKKEVIAEGGDETAGSNGLPQPKEPNGLRVLVVDDEPVNLEVLNNHLTLQGYEVVEAHNGLEALKKIEQDKKLDLILLDIMMPKMSGYEVCQRLREIYLPNELPIVMVTAKSSIQNIVEGLETGANDYLTKPFSKDELLSRVKTHLNLYGINKATNRFLPSQFLKAIGRDSIVEVQLGDLANQELNVFFSDLRGFTQISENMGAEEAFHLINEYNKLMGPEILKNGGFINQYQGDSIMAMFPDSSDEALTACISMQRKLEEHNKNAQIKLHSGMGLHSGPLVLGITGDGERLDTTVISDTVNIASRIEDLTKYYRTNILISESSKKRLTNPDNFDFRYLGKVRLKGKKNPIGVYECLNGEPSKVHDLKIKTSKFFSEGIDSYYQKKFPKATVAFQEVLEIHPEDETAKMFLSLSGKYIASGVPADWSGIQNIEN